MNTISSSIRIEVEDSDGFLPRKAHPEDAGYDCFANVDGLLAIDPGKTALVPLGFRIAVPSGYEAQIRPRSGNALKLGLQIANAPGTIDCGYRGEVGAIVFNSSEAMRIIHRGDRIAQMVIQRLPDIELVPARLSDDTARGEGGFGSTGV